MAARHAALPPTDQRLTVNYLTYHTERHQHVNTPPITSPWPRRSTYVTHAPMNSAAPAERKEETDENLRSSNHHQDQEPLTLNLVNSTSEDLLVFRGRLGRQQVEILLDSGARGNFIRDTLATTLGLETTKNSDRKIILADGATYIGRKIARVPLATGTYHDRMDFISAPITYDVILGLPWLIRYNPILDWQRRQLTFHTDDGKRHLLIAPGRVKNNQTTDDDALTTKALARLLRSPSDGQQVFLCVIRNIDLFYQSVDEATKDQPPYLKKVLLDFDEVFQDVDSLPPHRDIDHKIELLPRL
jgi:hypothetical protein